MTGSTLNKFKSGRSLLSAIVITIAALFAISGPMLAQVGTQMSSEPKPTIVLVHGAFADSSSWEGVTRILLQQGYPVVAGSNPLRGVKNDADYIGTLLNSIKGPIVLVGHSYGGMVISNTPIGNNDVEALVYVDAFAPKAGEDAFKLSMIYPGSTIGPAILPVPLADGVTDLYVQQDKYLTQFAQDVPKADAQWMAATQRPVTDAALSEASGEPNWKTIPSWFIYGDNDLIIPPALHAFMAERAGSRETVVIADASHVPMVSQPDEVANFILKVATEAAAEAAVAG